MTTSTPSPDLTIFRGWDAPGEYVWSPFVTKLEARLRFSGISYSAQAGSTRKAPRGKIPYIELRSGDEGGKAAGQEVQTLGDSTLITKTFVEQGTLPDLNAGLSPEMKMLDLGLRASLEDKLYFYHTRERWILNYYTMRDHILSALPWLMRVLIGSIIYRGAVKTLDGQGSGRYTLDEVALLRSEIWETINGLLVSARSKSGATDNDEPFWALSGEEPTEADATLFGFIVSVLFCNAAPDSRKVVRGYSIILDYASRIHDRYFPDYEKWE